MPSSIQANPTAFEFDPEVTDFALGYRKAVKSRKADAFLALAESDDINDFQKSAALEQAAIHLRKEAGPIVERIPLEAVKKTAQMQHLLIQSKAPDVISEFGDEDLSKWPFWQRGVAYRTRGRAFFILKDGESAESDLTKALPWIADPRVLDSAWLALAQNRERNLDDAAGALSAYKEIVEGDESIGGADQFNALQGIARILTARGEFDEALSTLNRAKPEKLQGTWQTNILKSIDGVNEARKAAK